MKQTLIVDIIKQACARLHDKVRGKIVDVHFRRLCQTSHLTNLRKPRLSDMPSRTSSKIVSPSIYSFTMRSAAASTASISGMRMPTAFRRS